MKTYCVVQPDGKTYLLKAVSCFEVDNETYLHEAAIRFAVQNKRPMSLISFDLFRNVSTHQTRFENRLPIFVGARQFVKKGVAY